MPVTKELEMTFGDALEALKDGHLVQRRGWNGKGMYLYLDHMDESLSEDKRWGTVDSYEPCIVMFTADRKLQPGWLASQADMLATDWQVVPPPE